MAIIGYVYGPQGFRRPVTDDDALWAGRMLLGESGANAWVTNEGYAVLWTMLNRWVQTAVAGTLPKMTFGEFLQRYSKAINPAFLHGGSRDVTPEETEQERRRAVRRTLSWRQMPSELRKIVYNVLAGRVPSGPYTGLVHFGMPGVDIPGPNYIGPVRLPGVPTDSNEFYRLPQTVRWTESTVTVRSAATSSGVMFAGVGLAIGAVLVGAFMGLARVGSWGYR